MRIDTHTHTSHYSPCGCMTGDELIESALKAKLDGLVVTDHSLGWLPWPDDAWQLLHRKAAAQGLTLFRGVEMTCRDRRHYLCYGSLAFLSASGLVSPALEWSEALYDRAPDPVSFVQAAQDCGCCVVLAHPYRKAEAVIPDSVKDLGLDGVEVQSNNLPSPRQWRLGLDLADELSCAATAGSDAHSPSVVGLYGLDMDHTITDEVELAQAIKEGAFQRFVNSTLFQG